MSDTPEERQALPLSPWPRVEEPGKKARREGVVLALMLSLGLALRLYGLGFQSIWIDEARSLAWAKLGLESIVYEGAHDNQTPLYFILLRAWMRLGPGTETWARLLSALLGTAFIGVFYLFVREIAERPVPLISAGLLALSPFAVWHSQDARMYTLMMVSSYVGLLSLLQYVRRGGRGLLVGSGLALECALYSHFYMLFLLPVLLMFLWLSRRDIPAHRLRGAVLAVASVGVGYLPWIVTVLTTSRLDAGFYKPISILSVPYALYAFSVGYSLGPSVAELHNEELISATLRAHMPVILSVTCVFGTACLRGLARVRSCCGRFGPLVYLLLSLPIVFPVVVTLVSRVTFNARYAIAAFPAYLLVLGVGVATIRPRPLSALVGGGLAALMVASLVGHYCDPGYAKADSRAAYHLIRARKQPGDCVLVLGVTDAFRYYEGGELGSRWLDLRHRDRIRDAEKALREWSGECSGLWVVSGRSWEDDPFGVADNLVGRYFRRVEERSLPGVQVTQYRSRNFDLDRIRSPKGRKNGSRKWDPRW